MTRPWIAALVLATSVSSNAGVVRSEPVTRRDGAHWSADARELFPEKRPLPFRVPSPDGRSAIVMENSELLVESNGARIFHATVKAPAELLWSPDSSAFAVTFRESEEEGAWSVRLFALAGESVSESDPTVAVTGDFLPRFKCADPEIPSVGAVSWLKGSSQLLLVARVPDPPGCTEAGAVRGYVVSAPGGRILSTLAEPDLKRTYRERLGRAFRG
jgi:hypothetical protein